MAVEDKSLHTAACNTICGTKFEILAVHVEL